LAFVLFVTSDPLSGYEGMPFEKQLIRHENYSMRMFFRIHGIPSSMGKGEIDDF
jgi:hypothetical protein